MSDHRSTWSRLRSWRHRGGKEKGKDNKPEDSLAIHGSRAGRTSVHNQVLTAPVLDSGTASASSTQQTLEPVSQAQVSQEPPSDQPHAKSSPPKPYAENYDLWEEALNSLEEEERSNVKALLKDLDHGHPKRKDLVGEIQKTLDGALKSKHHDRTTSIGKLLSVLNKFLSAGDVAVSFDPTHAALPWAAVRCVIVVFTAHNELKGVILTGMAEVTSLLVRCDLYQLLYMAPDPALRPQEALLAMLRACIVQTYAGLQSFFAFVERQQRSFKIGDVFKLEDARSYIDRLSGCQKRLLQAADDCKKSCDLLGRYDLQELLNLSSEVPIIRQQVDLVLERMDAKEERELLEWISPIPYGTHHLVRVESRTPDTCEWLLETEEFCDWMDYGSSAILRLRGSMGAGKTYLTSKVIDHVHGLLESSSDHTGFAFFYCNRNETNRRDPLCVLQSYVRQLSSPVGSTGHIRKSLSTVSDERRRLGSHLDFETCKTQLLEAVNDYSQSVIVLDALDECDEHSRWRLIGVLNDLVSKSDRPLKVFISSRNEDDIRMQLSGNNIEIQAINNQSDIEKFVHAEIDRPRRWGPIPADLRSKIVQVLCKDSQGMFQWAYLQIKQVLELSTSTDIEIKLGKLPSDLESAYEEIYKEIAKDLYRQTLVDRACKWVMSACTPLTSNELLSAVHIDAHGSSIVSKDKINQSDLLDLCSNLLVIDPQTRLWRLSHLSVREFFERNHWGLREIHSHSAKVCLKLLIDMYKSYFFQTGMTGSGHMHNIGKTDERCFSYPMRDYVRHHWVIHVKAYEENTSREQKADSWLENLLKRFLGSPTKSSLPYRAWFLSLSDWPIPQSSFLQSTMKAEISPMEVTIRVICRFSFYFLLQDWWENAEITPSQVDYDGTATLGLAAKAGCIPICNTLIKRAKQTHSPLPKGFYGAALAIAARKGYTEIAQILVENGADVNFGLPEDHREHSLISTAREDNFPLPGRLCGSALFAAASQGQIKIVKMLIKNGADVNLRSSYGDFGSALVAASREGKTETVKILVENGANVNLVVRSGAYGSALIAAVARRGNWIKPEIGIVKFLISNGANVNLLVPRKTRWLSIFVAPSKKEIEIAQAYWHNVVRGSFLSPSLFFESALIAAAYEGSIEVVKILIENGADVNLPLRRGRFGSALVAAVYMERTEIVKILIENGADVNFRPLCGDFGNALVAAASTKALKIVKILIENGADVNLPLRRGRFGSALVAAVYLGRTEIVQILVENGADVNPPLRYGIFGSVLAAAADPFRGVVNKEIQKILVDNGATLGPFFRVWIFYKWLTSFGIRFSLFTCIFVCFMAFEYLRR